jgi:hypothetical protein
MKKLMEFDDFSDSGDILGLNDMEREQIKTWIQKYEKYFNFHDSGNFMDSIDQITKDALEQLDIDKSKSDDVQDYIQSLYDLSDGISVIMAPNKELNLNDIDQVQRFQY